MDARTTTKGEILQLNPQTVKNPMFAGCLLVVTDPKAWGVQGYVHALGTGGQPGGQAYYRATWPELEETGGRAPWVAE